MWKGLGGGREGGGGPKFYLKILTFFFPVAKGTISIFFKG